MLHRRGFTLIELLVTIGIISALAVVVIAAVNPRKNLLSAYDTERRHNARQLQNAMYAYLVRKWELAGGGNLGVGQANAKPICKAMTSAADCASVQGVDLSTLPPEFIAALPNDPAEPLLSRCIGYLAYREHERPAVLAAHLGKMPGEAQSTCCVSGGDPYVICTCGDLAQVASNPAGVFAIGSNVDCSGTPSFNPIAGPFTGTLDGEGLRIKNLTINAPGDPNIGLFEQIGAELNGPGTVKNLTLENVDITGGSSAAGALAGMNLGTVENVHVQGGTVRSNARAGGLIGMNVGTVRSSSASANVMGQANPGGVFAGGLVGEHGAGLIENAFATGNVSGTEPAYGQVGGLVGRIVAGTIRNSYATGNVSGAATGPFSGVGGIVGYSPIASFVINSYATGPVMGPVAGGLIGNGIGSPQNSYWYDQTGDSAISCIGAGGGSCTAVSAPSNLFDSTHNVYDTAAPLWDFATIWQSNHPTSYPTLR